LKNVCHLMNLVIYLKFKCYLKQLLWNRL
jgi:hypothetical protein